MKKIITISVALFLAATLWAQSPEKMSYQAVIRNSSDALVTNTQIGMQISILQGSVSGTAIYVENQSPTTNANGLISIEIGGETGWNTIDWANGPYFIKTETDPNGGTDYTITGTNQLLGVPYAYYANTAGNVFSGDYNDLSNIPDLSNFDQDASDDFDGDYNNLTNAPDFTSWDTNVSDDFSGSYNNLTDVPVNLDTDNTDDFSGSYNDLTDVPVNLDTDNTDDFSGNYNDLSNQPDFTNWDNDVTDDFDGQYSSLTGTPALSTVATTGNYSDLTGTPTNLSEFTNDEGFLTVEVDGDATNEIEMPTDATSGDMSYYDGTDWIKVEAPTSNNMVLTFCDGVPTWTSNGQCPIEIGDFAYGGVIFYIFQSGDAGYVEGEQHGLVCAIEDQSNAPWGCGFTDITGADGTAIGTGEQNTIDIETGCSEVGTAADICANLSLNGYDDWFLPSLDELQEVFNNRAIINATATANGGSTFDADHYWSSSEYDDYEAWEVYFSTLGQQMKYARAVSRHVRAIRSF